MENFGQRVSLRLVNGDSYILRNVTEIHWNFNRCDNVWETEALVAFESNIHSAGRNFHMSDVLEFEALLDCAVASEFETLTNHARK